MKKYIFLLVVLITVLFTACVRTTFKGSEKEAMTHNINNIFN